MGFFSKLFGDNGEKEYRESLERELTALKADNAKALEKEKNTIYELQAKLQAESESKEKLQQEVQLLHAKEQQWEEQIRKQQEMYEAQRNELNEYKENYDMVSEVLVMAQKDADAKIREAEAEAGRIKEKAKMETYLSKQQAEREIRERYDADRKHFTYAQSKLMQKVDVINGTHDKLMEAYKELGGLLKELPMGVETLFPEEYSNYMLDEDGNKTTDKENTVANL